MTYAFGPFRYDAAQRLLFRGGELLPLAPKTLELLHVLVERRGTVVEKPELMRLVWPDANVEEIGLARNISLLRKALEDESGEYIETIPKRGYRFVAADPARRVRFRRHWLIATLVVLAAGIIYYQFYVPSRFLPRRSGGASLAVVPFDCLSRGPDRLCEAFSGQLVADLARQGRLQVIAPSTVRRHQRAGVSMGLMGRLLGLDVLVEGTVTQADGGRRINALLVDVHTGRVVWAETYTAASDAAAEDTVAPAIAAEIARRLSEGIPKGLSRPGGGKLESP